MRSLLGWPPPVRRAALLRPLRREQWFSAAPGRLSLLWPPLLPSPVHQHGENSAASAWSPPLSMPRRRLAGSRWAAFASPSRPRHAYGSGGVIRASPWSAWVLLSADGGTRLPLRRISPSWTSVTGHSSETACEQLRSPSHKRLSAFIASFSFSQVASPWR